MRGDDHWLPWLFLIVGLTILVCLIGQTYNVLQFLFHYSYIEVDVTKCKLELTRCVQVIFREAKDPTDTIFNPYGAPDYVNFWEFTIVTKQIPYPVRKLDVTQPYLCWGDDHPTKNWCSIPKLGMYHYDKLKVAVPHDISEPRPSIFRLFFAGHESSIAGLLVFFTIIYGCLPVVLGVFYFFHNLKAIQFTSELASNNKLDSAISYFNHKISVLVIAVLALAFNVGLGLAILRGMAYVESSNILLTGLAASSGLMLLSFGPGVITRLVFFVRSTRNEMITLLKNLLVCAGLVGLIIKIWDYLRNEEVVSDSSKSIAGLFVEIIKAIFS